MARVIYYVFLLVALNPASVPAQSLVAGEEGRPHYARRYTADEYRLHNQNWSVAQDARGVVYAANTYGVLEYDGRAWRTISIPNELVRSLAVGKDGQVYVGGIQEVGYLTPGLLGEMRYVSLLDRLPEAARGFSDVWTTLATPDGVYFQAPGYVFRWDGQQMQVWTTDDRFHKAFVVGDTYYVREENVGLLRIRGDELEPVPGGDRFADERIDVLLPHEENALLVRTRTQGFLRIDGEQIHPFETEADAYLADRRVYHAAVLHDGSYALTTTSGSVVLMGRDGQVRRILGSDIGLQPDDLVLFAMPDQQRGLWLALDDGLLRVDVPAALTLFGSSSGLQGTVYDMFRHDGTLFVGTTQGLYRLQPGRSLEGNAAVFEPPRFVPVEGVSEQSYLMFSAGESLLVATNGGVYEVRDGRTRLVQEGKAFALWQDVRTGEVLAGLKEGVAVLENGPHGWAGTGRLRGVNEEIRSIGQAEDGTLWLGTLLNGILHVEREEDGGVQRYGTADGLPDGPVLVWSFGSGVAFHTMQGLYRLEDRTDSDRKTFVPDSVLNAAVRPDGDTHYVVAEGAEGELWIARDRQVELYRPDERGALVDRTPPALHIPGIRVRSVFDEGNGVVWVATEEGLFRYDGTTDKTYAEPYRALVRRVTARNDTPVYGGTEPEEGSDEPPRIAYERNSLRLKFSAPTFNAPEATHYQYWLEGFDEGWSAWSGETQKEYTNLPEATYHIRVRARNAQGVISEEAVYTVRVLPPWYRTWWAYTLYGLLAATVLWAYGRVRIRHHARELERERAVNRQLETANTRLRQANERLHQADKLKDDFLANTSHELRTPLTSILGFASVLQEELRGEARTFAAMIQQGGERLLGTVNALLDMARLQADLMELEPTDLDVVEEVREIVRMLEPQAAHKGLALTVVPERADLTARMDRFCLERILVNIVGNAIKFTDEGGVTVFVDATDAEVLLTVRDTGIGIREESLSDIFSEFRQASTGYARTYEGNGLGLSITQRTVQLLGGDIEVESEVERGSEFRIRLPRYDRREALVPAPDAEALFPEPPRLLLVEEPTRPQARLRHFLEPHVRLDVVTGEAAGMEAMRAARYDLVLLDSQLPALDSGLSLLDAVRLLPGYEGTPVVAVTSYAVPGDWELYRRLGFAGHVGRPITKQRLMRVLDEALSALVEA